MSKPHAVLLGFIALGTTVVLLTGCSPSNPPAATPSPTVTVSSPPASTSQVCAAIDAHTAALANFKATLKPDATIEQVNAARDQVTKTYDDLVKASENLAQQRADAVKAAEAKFNAAVAAVPNDATLTQAADSLRDEASNVEAAIRDLRAEVQC
jgi:vacuolar-type H+-ATPase subunit I/STV1